MVKFSKFINVLHIILLNRYDNINWESQKQNLYIHNYEIIDIYRKILDSTDDLYHTHIIRLFYDFTKLINKENRMHLPLSLELFKITHDKTLNEDEKILKNVTVNESLATNFIKFNIKNIMIQKLELRNMPDNILSNTGVLPYFDDIINIIKQNKINSIEYYQRHSHGNMYYLDFSEFVQKIGYNEHIKKISFLDASVIDLYQILHTFPNLTSLCLTDQLIYHNEKHREINFLPKSTFLKNTIESNIQFNKLTHLTLYNLLDRLPKGILIDLIRRIPNLTHFYARYCYNLTDDVMEILFENKNIISLDVDSCKNISLDTFYKILDIWPNLKKFNICSNNVLTEDYLICIAHKLKSLDECNLSIWYDQHWHNKNISIETIACFIKYYNFKEVASYLNKYIKEKITDEVYNNFLERVNLIDM